MVATEDYGVVIGINDYKNPPYGSLQGAKQDAQDFVDWLKSPAGGDLPDQNVDPFTKLSNTAGNEPTLSDLWKVLNKVRKLATPGRKRIGRRLYLFFAGHGVSPLDLDEAGLVTLEAEETLTAYLAGKDNADAFCFASRFDEVLLFMDCCRVSDLLIERISNPFAEKPNPVAAGKVKRFYAFATAFGKTSRENAAGGIVRGIFSRVLLEGLKGGAPPDAGGRLTTTQLRAYLEAELKKVKIDGEEQVPKFPASDEIVLVEGLAPKRITVNLTFSQPGMQSLNVLDGGNNLAPIVLQDDVAIPGGRQFTLSAGKTYMIQALDASGKVVGMTLLKPEAEVANATI
jgi:hypothetical protein